MTSFPTDGHRGRTVRRPSHTTAPIAPHTEVRAGGRIAAQATTAVLSDASGDILHIHLECAAGHQPPWARRLLVHDLLTRAEHAHIERVLVVLPLGDSEILDVLREHCRDLKSRPAGASCIVDAVIEPQRVRARAS